MFLSFIKLEHLSKALNPNFSYIVYIGLEYVIALPKKVLNCFVLCCKNFGRLEFHMLKNFGQFYLRTLFLSEIFCK